MTQTLRAFMRRLIDYAGLFPPAKLPLDLAIRNYIHYRQSPDNEMLGRFICPASQLAELRPYHAEWGKQPLEISVLGKGGQTGHEFREAFQADLRAMVDFNRALGDSVSLPIFEVKIPVDLLKDGNPELLADLMNSVANEAASYHFHDLTIFYETSFTGNFRHLIDITCQSIANFNQQSDKIKAGYKIRCGGIDAGAFPPVEQVATVIKACLDFGAPLKATAGLHHPLRHDNAGVGTKMHGFLNVFGAGILAAIHQWPEAIIVELLTDENAANFHFDEREFRWKNWAATVPDIESVRNALMTSYGSCSFDEPRADLAALNLILM